MRRARKPSVRILVSRILRVIHRRTFRRWDFSEWTGGYVLYNLNFVECIEPEVNQFGGFAFLTLRAKTPHIKAKILFQQF